MAFADFTLSEVLARFDLDLSEQADLFLAAPEVVPSQGLMIQLRRFTPIVLAVNTEKARSEWLIAPILGEVLTQLEGRISIFSGTEFNVNAERGLKGYCDFILSRSAIQHIITAPVAMIVESKNDNLPSGLGQCVAGLVAARDFNIQRKNTIPTLVGAVTTGNLWNFLSLQDKRLSLDRRTYDLHEVPKVVGIFVHAMQA